MKVFAVLLVTCAVAVQAASVHDGLAVMKAASQKCAKELGFSEDQLKKHIKSGSLEKEDCFQACVFKDIGILDDKNVLYKEKSLQFSHPALNEEEKHKIADICFEKKGANACETAALLNNCLREHIPAPPKDPEVEKAKKFCQDKFKLSDDFVEEWREFNNDVKEDCFGACVAKEVGIVSEDGSFNTKKAVEKTPPHVPKDAFEKAAELCKDKKGANECETISVIRKCVQEHLAAQH